MPEEATPLDYSLNFETVTAPPEASTAAGDQSMLQFSAERIAEPESNTTDDDELVPVVSRTSLSRFTGKSAMPTQVSNRLGSKRQSSAVDVLPRKRARGGRGSRAIQPLDVALER